jgi:hypothetical protein
MTKAAWTILSYLVSLTGLSALHRCRRFGHNGGAIGTALFQRARRGQQPEGETTSGQSSANLMTHPRAGCPAPYPYPAISAAISFELCVISGPFFDEDDHP